MSVSLDSASKFKQQSRATSFSTACAGLSRTRPALDVSATGQNTIQAILVRRLRHLSLQSKDDKRLR